MEKNFINPFKGLGEPVQQVKKVRKNFGKSMAVKGQALDLKKAVINMTQGNMFGVIQYPVQYDTIGDEFNFSTKIDPVDPLTQSTFLKEQLADVKSDFRQRLSNAPDNSAE